MLSRPDARRVCMFAAVMATAVLTPIAARGQSTLVVSDHGIAGVRFGLPEAKTVTKLRALLGRPSRRFGNTGCGSRFAEVAWGHLYVEFRSGRFSGFRYIVRGWPPTQAGTKPLRSDRPSLTTPHGVTLGSTLHELHVAYRRLGHIGSDRWRSPDGLIFYDSANRDPEPATSRIIEIKIGTCGDF